jgi:pyruvate dehydrogenase E1 component alpha subunit
METGKVAICFFGEGALGQGIIYEVMNIAPLWKLPVIYVCENNLYNEYTHYRETTAGDLSARAKGFGIYSEVVDGQDVRKVYETALRLVKRARQGEGPGFLLCNTYRYRGHHVGDIDRSYYRSKTQRDPLKILAEWLLEKGLTEQAVLDQIDQEAQNEIESGADYATKAPYPEQSEVDLHVYA